MFTNIKPFKNASKCLNSGDPDLPDVPVQSVNGKQKETSWHRLGYLKLDRADSVPSGKTSPTQTDLWRTFDWPLTRLNPSQSIPSINAMNSANFRWTLALLWQQRTRSSSCLSCCSSCWCHRRLSAKSAPSDVAVTAVGRTAPAPTWPGALGPYPRTPGS